VGLLESEMGVIFRCEEDDKVKKGGVFEIPVQGVPQVSHRLGDFGMNASSSHGYARGASLSCSCAHLGRRAVRLWM